METSYPWDTSTIKDKYAQKFKQLGSECMKQSKWVTRDDKITAAMPSLFCLFSHLCDYYVKYSLRISSFIVW